MNVGNLAVSELKIGYDNGVKLIAHIPKIATEAGALYALIGKNGCGKSTLLRTLGGLQKQLAGDIWYNGASISQLSAIDLAKEVAVVTTDRPQMGYASVFDVVASGRFPHLGKYGRLKTKDYEVIHGALKTVHLFDKKDEVFEKLSDGQAQKVMLAKALAQETPFILLDEPMAFLDLPSKMELSQTLLDLCEHHGKTVIMSTHDLDLAMATATELWLLDEGVLTQGVPEELALNGVLANTFNRGQVQFDDGTGRFEFFKERKAFFKADISSHPKCKFWLHKAMNRLGWFEQSSKAKLRISYEASNWVVDDNKKTHHFSTLAALVNFIKKIP